MSKKGLANSGKPYSKRETRENVSNRNGQQTIQSGTSEFQKFEILSKFRAESLRNATEETKQRVPVKLAKKPVLSLASQGNNKQKLLEPDSPPNPSEESDAPLKFRISIRIEGSGVSFGVLVSQTDTIANIKSEISRRELIPTDRQILKFSGRVLLDNETISDANIKKGTMLMVALIANSSGRTSEGLPSRDNPEACFIYIQNMEEKKIKYYVDLNESVISLKLKIMDAQGAFPVDQRLVLASQNMEDNDRSLADYGVTSGSIIHLIQLRRGC